MGDGSVQELASTAWAYATASRPDEQLFAVLAMVAEQRLDEFHVQALANTAWAFAKVGRLDLPLWTAMGRTT